MGKISVIIPIYNVEKYLDRCIESILDQTYENFELILIDDGSTDKSGEIADSYAAKDERVIVKHVINSGSSSARNKGLDIATGEYIAFVDSDDYVEPEYLESLYNNMTDEVDLVASQANYFDEAGRLKHVIDPGADTIMQYDDVRNFMGNNRHFWVWSALYKREMIAELRFNTEYHVGEDTLFYLTYLHGVRAVRHTSERIYNYIMYPTSACHGDYSEKKYTELYAWRDICQLFADSIEVSKVCRGQYARKAYMLYDKMRQSGINDEAKKKEMRSIMRKNLINYIKLQGYRKTKITYLNYMLFMLGGERILDLHKRDNGKKR